MTCLFHVFSSSITMYYVYAHLCKCKTQHTGRYQYFGTCTKLIIFHQLTGPWWSCVSSIQRAVDLPEVWSCLQLPRLEGFTRGGQQSENLPSLSQVGAVRQIGAGGTESLLYWQWTTHTCICALWSCDNRKNHNVSPSVSVSLSLSLSLSPSSYVTIPCAHLACPYHYLLHRYWKSVQIPHLASEWTERCPFCSTPLNHDKPAIKLLFN